MPSTLADQVLAAAVRRIGGGDREGQRRMAAEVAEACSSGHHLLVQAGTGTGKSLGYLVPVLLELTHNPERRAVVATATLALQTQLATKDVPVALAALEEVTGKQLRSALLKGRSNYACLLRIRDGVGEEQASLLGAGEMVEAMRASADAESVLGAEVLALREWAESELAEHSLADRDDAPSHSPRAWAQVSVPVRECLGAQRCPYGQECFVEASRAKAREADLVVTNHALLAIDAMHGHTALPEHDLVVIDEAHELASRVTGAASAELSPQILDRVTKRAMTWLDDETSLHLVELVDDLNDALEAVPPARITEPDSPAVLAFQAVRAATRQALTDFGKDDGGPDKTQAKAAMQEVFDIADRMARLDADDVVWVSERERFGRQAVVAPLSVAGLMRARVLAEATTILTSATLQLGGSFAAAADSVGLLRTEDIDAGVAGDADDGLRWRGLDVGSPFDYRRQGILYVARQLPPPRRDGITEETLTEIAELVWAADGRTLGLFASQRSAEAAAAHVRRELPALTVLCQGEAQLPELVKRFVAEPATSLFGTLSLWQGIDVPGETCQLVIIDKIPFPRPDEPLLLARQDAVKAAGGNGFMQVAAAHAALLLAQGSGRLIRRSSDRGVVAVLDPRLVTARYGSYLRASMPPLWPTSDREVVVGALRRLAGDAASTT